MHRDASRNADANSTHLAFGLAFASSQPYARPAPHTTRVEAQIGDRSDQRLFDTAYIVHDQDMRGQFGDRIAHKLTGTVEGDFSATININHRRTDRTFVGLSAFTGGIDSRMLNKQCDVADIFGHSLCVHVSLKLPCLQVVKQADLAHFKSGHMHTISRWNTFAMNRAKRMWVWPLLVVLVWLFIGGPLGAFAGKLAQVQENDNAAFLPDQAESTKVIDYQSKIIDPNIAVAIVVWEFADKATAMQASEVKKQLRAIAQIDRIDKSGIVGPVQSKDGRAFQAQVPIDLSGNSEELGDGVSDIRALLDKANPDTVNTHVTGLAGLLADFIDAFGAIDGVLLIVALGVVLLILLIVYRSPVLPFLVLASAVLALGVASSVVYALATAGTIDVNGQSQGILFILVVGAATDYALLLVSRFREELREHDSKYDAMKVAYRGTAEPILASGTTVILGLMCLLFSGLGSLQGLGPVGSLGVAAAMLAALTFLPAALLLLGRKAFWPFMPHLGSPHPETQGIWARVSRLVGDHPRRTWVLAFVGLAFFAAFLPQFRDEGISQSDSFMTKVDSVVGQDALAKHFPAGLGDPAYILAAPQQSEEVAKIVAADPGISQVSKDIVPVGDKVLIPAILKDESDSAAAENTVERLRESLDAVSTDVLIGGNTAVTLDTLDQSTTDRNTIIPIILIVIFVVLALLLRAVVAPLILIGANVLSFAATLGLSSIVFNHILDFKGGDPSVTLIAFVFLVALGIDYTIFLMTRVREESLKHGTRPGILRGLRSTGGVITSAGVVLAATFSALAILPILFLAQIAFIVAAGVLIDTIIVRSLLVPALSYDVGQKIWWPSKLGRADTCGKHRAIQT